MQITDLHIFQLRNSGVSVKVIAKQYGVSPSTIKDALRAARLKIDGAAEVRSSELFNAGKDDLLKMLAHGPASSAQVRERLSKFSERQIQRLLNGASKANLIASRGRGRSLQWYTPQMLAAVLELEAAMFCGGKKSPTVRLSNSMPKGEIIIPASVKITRAPTPPGRFDVTLPKDAGVISQDWKARRLAEVQQ